MTINYLPEYEKDSILCLDIDGILTTPATKWRDFDLECVKNLKYIIKETDCKIVVHSTWRNFPDKRKLFFYLWGKHNLPLDSFIDFAPTGLKIVKDNVLKDNNIESNKDIEYYASKKEVIEQWLENNKYRVDSYCILDDEDYNFDSKIFVRPICSFGLSYENALDVIRILNK